MMEMENAQLKSDNYLQLNEILQVEGELNQLKEGKQKEAVSSEIQINELQGKIEDSQKRLKEQEDEISKRAERINSL